MLRIPAFNETDFKIERENDVATVTNIVNAAKNFQQYNALFLEEGFALIESYTTHKRSFAAYNKDNVGIFMNAFYSTGELQIVVEEESAYFTYSDLAGEEITTPQLTCVKLTDYGLSYVVRLTDGRFIVIDGGNRVEEEADALYACLKDQSPFEVPVIATWIITHPHSDHYYCFFPFMERHGTEVRIEKFLYNFPDADDAAHYPYLAERCKRIPECTNGEVMKRFLKIVKETSAPVYTARTGQRYQIGNVMLEIFASIDDSIHCSTSSVNFASLMFTTKVAGQTVFWGGDGSFSDTRLPDRYGSELKSDILQVPHHGFGCGTDKAQIEGYKYISPRVCLLPASHSEAYSTFTTHKPGTNYLMTRLGVEELITGKELRILELPYEPQPGGAIELRQQYLEGRDDCGARTWIFTDLSAARMEDYIFSSLNTTYLNANISVELFFDNANRKIVRFITNGKRLGLSKINCAQCSEDAEDFDFSVFMENNSILEETTFAVRFICDIPIVISHATHKPAYHSTVV